MENPERFWRFFENSAAAIAIFNPDTTIRNVNDAFCRMSGYSREELTGMSWTRLVPQEDLDRILEYNRRRLLNPNDAPRQYEFSFRSKDGQTREAEVSVTVLPSLGETIATFVDITGRKRAERALQRSEARFKQIAENDADFIWEVDAEGLYTYASPAVERILGYAPDELVGKVHFFDLFAPDVRESLKAAALRTFSEKKGFRDFLNPNVRKDGSLVILETSGTPFLDESGGFAGYRGFDKDATLRRRVEEQLLIKQSAIDSAMSAIGFADMEQRIFYVNRAYLELWGYDREEEILGRPIAEFAAIPGQVEKAVAAMKSGKGYVGEGISHKKDGTEFMFQIATNLVSSPEGRPLCMMASFIDITARKRAEEELRQAVRQTEILMKELKHRVKNSLALVSGLLHIAMSNLPDGRVKEIFADTRSRIHSIASLYERLYVSSEIENVDLRAYIGNLAKDLLKTYVNGNFRLETRLEDIKLDTRRAVPLGLILNELVTNALKYAYPAGARGEIRVELQKAGNEIVLGVSDDGAGWPKDFSPESGGGVGMNLVRMLADEIDASLAFPPGRGAAVTVTFGI